MRQGRLEPVSPKRRAQQDDRRALASPLEHERCWVGLDGCTGWAEHWHELVGSGQGGSRTDPRNLCAACDACNDAIETHPQRFRRRLKVRRSDTVAGDGGLVPAVPHPLSLAERWL